MSLELESLLDSYEDTYSYFEGCDVGTTLDGEPIYSLKKILRKLKKDGYDTIEVLDNLNTHLAPLTNRGVIVLYDIETL